VTALAQTLDPEEIRAAIAEVKADGWSVERGWWAGIYRGERKCCPVGAAVIVRAKRDGRAIPGAVLDSDHAARLLGVDKEFLQGFADGFDNDAPEPEEGTADVYAAGYAMGESIWRELNPEAGS
jgi:hypothetical protein